MVAEELGRIEETFSSALRTALWELNHEQLVAIEEAILELPAVTGVTVRARDQGFEVDELGRHGDATSISHHFSLYRTFQGESIELAEVTLHSSRGVVLDRLEVNFALLFIAAAIKSLVLVSLFIWAFRKYLSRPLGALKDAITEVELDQLDRTRINLDIRQENELKQLERSYNQMLAKLAEEKARSDRTQREAQESLEQEVKRRTRELEALNQRLEELATTDSLTGVHNRRAFEERLSEELARAGRTNSPLSLIIMDLDHFKGINDRFGHAVGDEVLKDFVQTLSPLLRASDPLFRIGGEEFVILLPGSEAAAAQELAHRIRATIAARRLPSDRGEVRYTVSIGIASLAQTGPAAEDLLRAADRALYRAKETGRNRVET
jgi:diguanylate cyclase (GGDEF)-like protein